MRPDYYIAPDVVNKDEIDFITKEGMKNLVKATTFATRGTLKIDFKRRTKVAWFHKDKNKDLDKILNRVVDMLFSVSKNFYNQELNNVEPIQFTHYKFLNYYNYHMDSSAWPETPNRVISATIELTNPKNYIGGGLQFKNHAFPRPKLNSGTMIVFPSLMIHKALPIYFGIRNSLVLWAGLEDKNEST